MKANFEIHPVQGKILKVLLFQTTANFSQLNPDKISTDQFSFHLRSLINSGLLEKISKNKYGLTVIGKEFANRLDTEKIVFERQAKLTLGAIPVKRVNGQKYYLIHQRLKQPWFGYYGSVNGKIRWGEKVLDAAKRELFEETGLTATKLKLVGVYHKMDFSFEKQLLEDKYFFQVRVDKFSGYLKDNPEGKNFWLTKEQIEKTDHLFTDLLEALLVYDQDGFLFTEKEFLAEGY